MRKIGGTYYDADVDAGMISRMLIDGHRAGIGGMDILFAAPVVGAAYEGDDGYTVQAVRPASAVTIDRSSQMEEDIIDDHAVVEIDLSENGGYSKSVYAIYPTPKTDRDIADEMIRRAEDSECLELYPGVWLATAAEMQAEQEDWDDKDESKHFDFSVSAYWLVTDDGKKVPIADADALAAEIAG